MHDHQAVARVLGITVNVMCALYWVFIVVQSRRVMKQVQAVLVPCLGIRCDHWIKPDPEGNPAYLCDDCNDDE